MLNKGTRQGPRLKGRARKYGKNGCQKGLYSKLAGLRSRPQAKRDCRPDPYQKVAVFECAERTGGFQIMVGGGWRR